MNRPFLLSLACSLALATGCASSDDAAPPTPSAGGGGAENTGGAAGKQGGQGGAAARAGTSGGGQAGQGTAGNGQGGKNAAGNGGAAGAGQGGSGQAGKGQAGSGQGGKSGSGQGGQGQSGSGQAGSGQAGQGQAGQGQAGQGQAGQGQAGQGQAGMGQAGGGSADGAFDTKCAEGQIEFPLRSGLCVDDPCAPDPCGGKGSCSSITGAAVCAPCTYFVDNSQGSDAGAGTSPGAAWKSLDRVNAADLGAGDRVCFRRGGSFAGALVVSHSGAAGKELSYGSYGEGPRPVLSGFTTLSGWTDTGGGIWKSSCAGCGERVNAVAINGAVTPMGRYPNLDAPNGGYLSYEAVIGTPNADSNGYYGTPYSGELGIVDNELEASPDWTGAEVVIRKIHYVLDRARVTSHQGHQVIYENPQTPAGNIGLPGWGYFFQASRQTLDRQGEWYYDPAAHEISVYFGDASPDAFVVEASSVGTLVTVKNHDHVTFEGLAFRGANDRTFLVDTATGVTIRSAQVSASGLTAIHASGTDSLTVEGTRIEDSNNTGILVRASQNATLRGNVIERTGVILGAGAPAATDGNYTGIFVDGSGTQDIHTLVDENLIEHTGYNGIHFVASGVTLQHNVVAGYNERLDDGAGIYTWRNGEPYTNRKIIGNIVLDGFGAPDGQPAPVTLLSAGIYLDNATNDVEVTGNTAAHAANAGLFENYAVNVTITGNTFFDNTQQVSLASLASQPLSANTFSDNLFFSKVASQICLLTGAEPGQLESFGSFDKNAYVRPTQDDLLFELRSNQGGARIYGLAGWQAAYGYDKNATATPIIYHPYSITSQGPNLVTGGDFAQDISQVFVWSEPGNHTAQHDGSGKLDQAGSLELSFTNPVDTFALVYGTSAFGALASDKSYVLRFSTRGTTEFGLLHATLRQTSDPYADLAPPQRRAFGTGKVDHEFFFTAPTSDAGATFVIAVNELSGTTYLDDIQVLEVTATTSDPTANIRFEVNGHSAPRTVPLDGSYLDAHSNPYSGSVTLDPYSSLVLLKTP